MVFFLLDVGSLKFKETQERRERGNQQVSCGQRQVLEPSGECFVLLVLSPDISGSWGPWW